MRNQLDLYTDAGRRAARATNEGDAPRAAEERRHHVLMLRFELAADRRAAQSAYDAGYKAVRHVPVWNPFP